LVVLQQKKHQNWGALGHRSLAVGAWLTPRNTLLLRVCYSAEFGRSSYNDSSVIKEIHLKIWPHAFQGHSRSSEPTPIDPPCT